MFCQITFNDAWNCKNAAAISFLSWNMAARSISSPDGCVRPLILFSHGRNGDPSSCSVLCIRLARAGFLIVAPHHEDRAVIRHQEQAAERVDDAAAVLDRLKLHHDRKRIGVAGHSFGGVTAAELGSQDRRVRAVLSMAGTPDLGTMRALAVPTLVMAGTRDPIETVVNSRTSEGAIASTVPHRLLVVQGARHGQLIDGCSAIGACERVGRAAEEFFLEYLAGVP